MKTTMMTALLALAVACGPPAEKTPPSQRVQDPPAEVPSCTVLKASGPIVVDGLLNESDWQQAPTIEFAFPWDDVTAVPAQSTVARMLWDEENLYIIYECVDPYLDSEVTEKDGPVYEEDAVEIFVTPNADDVSAYFGYEMNINGALLDYMAFKGGEERTENIHFEWENEGVQIATTHKGTLNDHSDTDEGWILEIAIPMDNFRHLGGTIPPQDGDLWRLNLNRTKGDKGQFSMWSDSHTPVADFHRSLYFGKATFSTKVVGQ